MKDAQIAPRSDTALPGYKALPDEYSGPAAEQVRYAEVLQRAGDVTEAVRMLEHTLEACARTKPELPGWLCGRLAALYRGLKRYDDEVLLLERYRESQTSEDARTRFDARLSKARAIAERKRRTETRALSSVRRVINGCEDDDVAVAIVVTNEDVDFRSDTMAALRDAFLAATAPDGDRAPLARAVQAMCGEARQLGYPPERIVAALRNAWHGTARPSFLPMEQWRALYREALTRALVIHFDAPGP